MLGTSKNDFERVDPQGKASRSVSSAIVRPHPDLIEEEGRQDSGRQWIPRSRLAVWNSDQGGDGTGGDRVLTRRDSIDAKRTVQVGGDSGQSRCVISRPVRLRIWQRGEKIFCQPSRSVCVSTDDVAGDTSEDGRVRRGRFGGGSAREQKSKEPLRSYQLFCRKGCHDDRSSW